MCQISSNQPFSYDIIQSTSWATASYKFKIGYRNVTNRLSWAKTDLRWQSGKPPCSLAKKTEILLGHLRKAQPSHHSSNPAFMLVIPLMLNDLQFLGPTYAVIHFIYLFIYYFSNIMPSDSSKLATGRHFVQVGCSVCECTINSERCAKFGGT